jgi:hypothetical protein
MYSASKVFRCFELAFHKGLIDDDLGSNVREFASLPGLHLLLHRPKVTLHAVDTDRDAVDERERLRVLCQHRREHARDNVAKLYRTRALQIAMVSNSERAPGVAPGDLVSNWTGKDRSAQDPRTGSSVVVKRGPCSSAR